MAFKLRAVVLLTAVLVFGCTSASDTPASDGLVPDVNKYLTDAPVEQQAALEDGVVSREELDEAARNWETCVLNAGFEVEVKWQESPDNWSPGSYVLDLPAVSDLAAAEQADYDCQLTWMANINAVYYLQNVDQRRLEQELQDLQVSEEPSS